MSSCACLCRERGCSECCYCGRSFPKPRVSKELRYLREIAEYSRRYIVMGLPADYEMLQKLLAEDAIREVERSKRERKKKDESRNCPRSPK